MVDKKIRNILENLNSVKDNKRKIDDSTRDLFERMEYLEVGDKVDERKVITFDEQSRPREGWAVIMAGGTGSGKGVVIDKQLLIDGKIIDVDDLKELYAEVSDKNWDFSNPEDVRKLHNIIKAKGWKQDLYNLFFNANDRLENIIFDITGKTVEALTRYSGMCDDLGYKVSLVWAVTNRMWALLRNLRRNRTVPENIFHEIHNLVRDSIFSFLDSDANRFVDEAWVVFSGGMGAVEPESLPDSAEELAGTVHKIEKRGGEFFMSESLKRKILMHLGPAEPDIADPDRYKDYDEIEQEMEPYWDEEEGRWVGYDDGVDLMKHDLA